jgi:hypothetical protein
MLLGRSCETHFPALKKVFWNSKAFTDPSGPTRLAGKLISGLAEYLIVSLQSLLHCVWVRFPQLRAAFYVGEEECDCTGWNGVRVLGELWRQVAPVYGSRVASPRM